MQPSEALASYQVPTPTPPHLPPPLHSRQQHVPTNGRVGALRAAGTGCSRHPGLPEGPVPHINSDTVLREGFAGGGGGGLGRGGGLIRRFTRDKPWDQSISSFQRQISAVFRIRIQLGFVVPKKCKKLLKSMSGLELEV